MADIDEPLANPPIDLPPFNNIVNLPPRPQNPPVSRDVVSGHKYEKDMVVAHAEGLVSDDHLADTFTYTLSLVQGRAGAAAAPAWFHVAMQQALQPINDRLDRLMTLTTKALRLCAINYNLQAASGAARPFEIVPFLDGSDPTSAPYELPPLLNAAAVTALPNQQSREYYKGYYVGNVPAVERRIQRILAAIGCK